MFVGPAVALEVSPVDGGASVDALRFFCGPADPITARTVREDSLRGLFGETKAANAVHCTDLQEDAERELGLAFQQAF